MRPVPVRREPGLVRGPCDVPRAGDHEDDEPDGLVDDVPDVPGLVVGDVHQREALADHDDAHDREPHGHLVRHHLCGVARSAQQRVLVAAAPAAEDEPRHANARPVDAEALAV